MSFTQYFDNNGNLISEEMITKDELLSSLNVLHQNSDSIHEAEPLNLIMNLIENDLVSEEAYMSIYDMAEEMANDYEDDTEPVNEAEIIDEVVPLWKKKGLKKIKIGGRTVYRKPGNTKPIDKKRSRILKMAKRKSSAKRNAKIGARKMKKTKRRLGY